MGQICICLWAIYVWVCVLLFVNVVGFVLVSDCCFELVFPSSFPFQVMRDLMVEVHVELYITAKITSRFETD